jgi:two-component system, NarL family, sensor histidine kinase UhpB
MMIENARKDVRAEVESTTVLALHLLDAQMKHYTSESDWNNVAAN